VGGPVNRVREGRGVIVIVIVAVVIMGCCSAVRWARRRRRCPAILRFIIDKELSATD
jgi:hypothetical protein